MVRAMHTSGGDQVANCLSRLLEQLSLLLLSFGEDSGKFNPLSIDFFLRLDHSPICICLVILLNAILE